jgi:hypothetical protein
MNHNKHIFTTQEFLAIPVYDEARLAKVGEDFLLKGHLSAQQDWLQFLLKEHGEANLALEIETAQQKNPKVDSRIKVKFWRKYKDGNVGEFGGTIALKKDESIVLKDDKLVLNFGDDDLSFSANGTEPVEAPPLEIV